jgi:hypothetical protein
MARCLAAGAPCTKERRSAAVLKDLLRMEVRHCGQGPLIGHFAEFGRRYAHLLELKAPAPLQVIEGGRAPYGSLRHRQPLSARLARLGRAFLSTQNTDIMRTFIVSAYA